jgi:hypothetical protein
VLTEHEQSSLEQKLSAAMIYAKHEDPEKSATTLDDFIDEAGHISADKEPTVKNTVSEIAQSARLLQEQLTPGRHMMR